MNIEIGLNTVLCSRFRYLLSSSREIVQNVDKDMTFNNFQKTLNSNFSLFNLALICLIRIVHSVKFGIQILKIKF